jgi:hypothetical protein
MRLDSARAIRSATGKHEIGFREITADAQQRLIRDFGDGVSEAIAEVECRLMGTAAETRIGIGRLFQ